MRVDNDENDRRMIYLSEIDLMRVLSEDLASSGLHQEFGGIEMIARAVDMKKSTHRVLSAADGKVEVELSASYCRKRLAEFPESCGCMQAEVRLPLEPYRSGSGSR